MENQAIVGDFFAFAFTFAFAYFSSCCGILLLFCDHCKFAIRAHFFLSSFDTEKRIIYIHTSWRNTIWSTLRMQLYILFFRSHCFDFFLCSSTSYFLSSHFHLCGCLYVGNMKKSQLSPLMLFLFMICKYAKKNAQKIKENRNVANSPWHFSSFKWKSFF